MAIGSKLSLMATVLVLAGGSMSFALAQGTKDPSNPIVPYPTNPQPPPSNTTPPTPNIYRYHYVPYNRGVLRLRRLHPVRRY
jgi:hypothetical protein